MKLRYRPDPARSVIEDLYSSEENPSPMLSLLEELYAIHAIGVTKFWVKDEKEISSMKLALQVCFSWKNCSLTIIFQGNKYKDHFNKKKMKNGQNWTFLHVFYMYHCSQAALMYNPDVTEVHIYVTQSNSKSPVQGEVEKFVKEFAQGGCPTYTREILSPFRIMDPPHSTFTIVKITIPLEKKSGTIATYF